MILIQIQLAIVSIFSLVIALLTVSPAVIGIILGVQQYTGLKSLQISSCLTAGAEICVTITQILAVIWPYQLFQVAANCISLLLLIGAGFFYICVRLQNLSQYGLMNHTLILERSFVCLWIISIITSSALTFFSLGATLVAHYGPEYGNGKSSCGIDPLEEPSGGSDNFSKDEASHGNTKKLSLGHPVRNLGSPVDIPNSCIIPGSGDLSPRLSWPSTVGSLRESDSLGSLQSALNARNITPPQQALTKQSDERRPKKKHSQLTLSDNGGELKSPSIKTPKSPLKIHLSKSSFSLRRSPSKTSQHKPNWTHQTTKIPNYGTSSPIMKTLEPYPLSIPIGIPVGPEPETPKSWVMIPNENLADARSVSGSSQLTGNIFPASEYNRKINSAGFQRDEPVPVQVKMVSPRQTLSQYDLERIHRQNKINS